MFLHLPICLSHINSLLPWRHSKLTWLILARNLAAKTWPTTFSCWSFQTVVQLSHVVQFVERRSGQTMETFGAPSPSQTTNTEQYPRPGPWVATVVSRTRVKSSSCCCCFYVRVLVRALIVRYLSGHVDDIDEHYVFGSMFHARM